MKLKEIKRPNSIPQSSYRNNMSLVGVNGGLSFPLRGCKEEVYHMVGKALGVKYDEASMDYIMGPSEFKEKINVKEPGIIFYVAEDLAFSQARRINRVVQLLHKKHRLKTTPSICLYKGSNALLIKVDKWYYKNPVNLSALLTFIRSAACHDFYFETLDDFIKRIIEDGCETDDGDQLFQAKRNGNLKGFLNKSLPIIKYKGNAWKWGRQDDMTWDGLVSYDKSEEHYYDISDGLSYDMYNDDFDNDVYCCYDCNGY